MPLSGNGFSVFSTTKQVNNMVIMVFIGVILVYIGVIAIGQMPKDMKLVR
jgi:hypothetical protein